MAAATVASGLCSGDPGFPTAAKGLRSLDSLTLGKQRPAPGLRRQERIREPLGRPREEKGCSGSSRAPPIGPIGTARSGPMRWTNGNVRSGRSRNSMPPDAMHLRVTGTVVAIVMGRPALCTAVSYASGTVPFRNDSWRHGMQGAGRSSSSPQRRLLNVSPSSGWAAPSLGSLLLVLVLVSPEFKVEELPEDKKAKLIPEESV